MSKLLKHSDWVRRFDIEETKLHPKGYTVYKVVSSVYPKNSLDASSKIVVWRRYSDFQKLHKALQHLHQGLYLKGDFPKLPKGKLFGRFDDQVIQERKEASLKLLEHAAQHALLFNSAAMNEFLSGATQLPVESSDDVTVFPVPALLPVSGGVQDGGAASAANDHDTTSTEEQLTSSVPLGNSWCLPNIDDLSSSIISSSSSAVSLLVSDEVDAAAFANTSPSHIITTGEKALEDTSIDTSIDGNPFKWSDLSLSQLSVTPAVSYAAPASSELAKYKVRSVVDNKLICVTDIRTRARFVVKGVYKNASQACRMASQMPLGVPYMIGVHGVHETSNAHFIVMPDYTHLRRLYDVVFGSGRYTDESVKNQSEDQHLCRQRLSSSDTKLNMDPRMSRTTTQSNVTMSHRRMWIAQLVNAIARLHQTGIIWKDLQSTNLLIDTNGDLLLTLECRLACVDSPLNADAVKKYYVAPELFDPYAIVTASCDWWSVGVVAYEILTGEYFHDVFPHGFQPTSVLTFPPEMLDDAAQDFLSRLICYKVSDRLGSGFSRTEHLRSHPFFKSIDWRYIQQ